MKKMIGVCPEFVKDIIDLSIIRGDFPSGLLDEYKSAWVGWLSNTDTYSVQGLGENFYQTNGVHDALLHLINAYSNNFFQIFSEDYLYYDYLLENKSYEKIFSLNQIKENAIIVLSYSGITDIKLKEVMRECDKKKAKIIVDCVYFGTTRNRSIQFNKSVIAAAFSLSKVFNLGGLRIGGLFTRDPLRTLEICQNSENYYFNTLAAQFGKEILNATSPDVLPSLFKPYQTMVCDELELIPLRPWFAAKSSLSKWQKHSRDKSPPYRLCITSHILERYQNDCDQGYYGTIYEKIREG